jgi:hypothetical protein
MAMLIANAKGNYSFLQGIAPYSGGVVAQPGYEVVHVRFGKPVPLETGFRRVRQYLDTASRSVNALCAMELRSPRPFTFEGFAEFNRGYVEVLREWGLLMENGVNPVARTNVAPATAAPSEPSLYAFSYTVPSATTRKTFVVAGSGELPEGSLDPKEIVPGSTREKAKFVMGLMQGRLQGLGVDWPDAVATNVYTIHPIGDLLDDLLAPAETHGVTWYYSYPPILGIEYEMDVRGCHTDIVLT